jgi:hypothetical protein
MRLRCRAPATRESRLFPDCSATWRHMVTASFAPTHEGHHDAIVSSLLRQLPGRATGRSWPGQRAGCALECQLRAKDFIDPARVAKSVSSADTNRSRPGRPRCRSRDGSSAAGCQPPGRTQCRLSFVTNPSPEGRPRVGRWREQGAPSRDDARPSAMAGSWSTLCSCSSAIVRLEIAPSRSRSSGKLAADHRAEHAPLIERSTRVVDIRAVGAPELARDLSPVPRPVGRARGDRLDG